MENKLSYRATGVALAGTLTALFIICAVAQVIVPDLQLTHMWISLFTAAPIGSATAWIEGLIANIVFGLVGWHLFAWIYNRN